VSPGVGINTVFSKPLFQLACWAEGSPSLQPADCRLMAGLTFFHFFTISSHPFLVGEMVMR
jgi:hypothetical protein